MERRVHPAGRIPRFRPRPRSREHRLLEHDLAHPLLRRHGRDRVPRRRRRHLKAGRQRGALGGLEAASGVGTRGARGGTPQRVAESPRRGLRGTPSARRRRGHRAAGGEHGGGLMGTRNVIDHARDG
jgi:hypothetical protein